MLTSQKFFEDLREGDEYLNCFMTKEVYSGIELENRERICVNTVRKTNDKFKTDETHRSLSKNVSKAKKELLDYEYKLNNA